MNLFDKVKKYKKKFPLPEKWILQEINRLENAPVKFSAAIVIPAMGEYECLPATLRSISLNDYDYRVKTAVIVVVNNSKECTDSIYTDNELTVAYLKKKIQNINLYIVEAFKDNYCLPSSKGVGLARRIGLDLSLDILDMNLEVSPLMICLDSDTEVKQNYLKAIYNTFKPILKKKKLRLLGHAAVINYAHRMTEDYQNNMAIISYELYLRYYEMLLKYIGSRYSFHTIGSTMVASVKGYLGVGGMPAINACEDFYFMQKLAKTTSVLKIRNTCVMPSSRFEIRAPIGTGCHIRDSLIDNTFQKAPSPKTAVILKKWIEFIEENSEMDSQVYLNKAFELSVFFGNYLRSQSFEKGWENIKNNSSSKDNFLKHFHTWFDSFRIMRALNEMKNEYFEESILTAIESLFSIKPEKLTLSFIHKNFSYCPRLLDEITESQQRVIVDHLSMLWYLRDSYQENRL